MVDQTMQVNDETADVVGILRVQGECKEQTPKQVIRTTVDEVGKTTILKVCKICYPQVWKLHRERQSRQNPRYFLG